jgi:hypothetical protein
MPPSVLPHAYAAVGALVGVGESRIAKLLVKHDEEIVLVHVVEVSRFDGMTNAGRHLGIAAISR